MIKHSILSFLLILATACCISCGNTKKAVVDEPEVAAVGPTFRGDSAMVFCKMQCDFGPRVMNSKAHDDCGKWIADKFRSYGLDVEEQKAVVTGWDGTKLNSTNIIARYNKDAERRILICAHWDSRPWADNDPDSTNWKKPVLAANDGASGVGVMLEIARLLASGSDSTALKVGIDFVCFDAEDYGTPQWAEDEAVIDGDTWALGAQYFAQNLPYSIAGEDGKPVRPEFGILLDMVGGQGSRFHYEGLSKYYAQDVVNTVWQAASAAGAGSYFVNADGGTVTDDHKPLNEAGIPTIDIIPFFPDCQQSSFGPTWHTVFDDMEHLDKDVLEAVGQTLIQVLFADPLSH